LIYVAEIEAGNCELDIINFDLKPMVAELQNIFRPMASKKNVMIEFEIGTGLECIFADDSKFNAILHNLIENAIKFNREGGSVKIIFEDAGNDIRVQVIDTGIGILEDKQEIFFEPFVQLDWSHARRYSGVGIGLSLVKGLVEMHGGKISLVSKVGEGTTVTFTIPQKL
jgi:signal transduction histidine kinase